MMPDPTQLASIPTIPPLSISLIPGGSGTTATWSSTMVGPQHTNVLTARTAAPGTHFICSTLPSPTCGEDKKWAVFRDEGLTDRQHLPAPTPRTNAARVLWRPAAHTITTPIVTSGDFISHYMGILLCCILCLTNSEPTNVGYAHICLSGSEGGTQIGGKWVVRI